MKVDIHIIEDPQFDCSAQIKRLKHPMIEVHTTPYVSQNVLKARANGFALGTSPYVSWVDPDDEVLSVEWIPRAIQLLEENNSLIGVYPRQEQVKNGKIQLVTKGKPHHLSIVRRQPTLDFVNRLLLQVGWAVVVQDLFLLEHLSRKGEMREIDTIAYRWFKREGSTHQWRENPIVAMSWDKIKSW